MRRLLSTDFSVTSFNLTMLLLRCALGFLLLFNHGIPKLMKFANLQSSFFDPFGIGSKWALILVIFAEVFCAILLMVGLFSRMAVIPLIITMCVILFLSNKGEPLNKLELPILFLAGFVAVLLAGPGRLSVDGVIGK
ncbi:MAG TPA: DoxX family protein [Chitinophagaceae bacterium]|nr:DoxX family protein [Chitinophagaceae bacterium]